jgi:DNA repair protein RadC
MSLETTNGAAGGTTSGTSTDGATIAVDDAITGPAVVLRPAEGPRVSYLIRDMPSDDRPRERLAKYGAGNLSNAELLAILWRTGSSGKERESVLALAQRALNRFGSLGRLAKATITELCGISGVGEVKAIELHAALELGRRLAVAVPDERPVIHSPREVVNLVHSEMVLLEQEELWLLLLNSKNEVLAIRRTYRGTISSSSVRIAELFRSAIRETAASIIITHNHPSGDPTPSPEDVRVTADAVRAGDLLDVEVLDHIIVGGGRERFVSMKERGLGFVR